jgi:hypothetical protein
MPVGAGHTAVRFLYRPGVASVNQAGAHAARQARHARARGYGRQSSPKDSSVVGFSDARVCIANRYTH